MNKKNLTIKETFALAIQNHQNNNFKIAENFYKEILVTIVVSFVVGIKQKLLEQILQFIFQNLNTRQDQFVSRVITLTQSK